MIQQNIFNLIDEGFCFDNDINNIVEMLDGIFEKYEMIIESEKDWSIWEHVPYLGYRLSYYIYLNAPLPNQIFEELAKVTKYAKNNQIEAEPFGYSFYEYGNTGIMSIYTTYKDERIKLK